MNAENIRPKLLWILNKNHEPVPAQDVVEWSKWFEVPENRIVKQEDVGPYFVSTVFMGVLTFPMHTDVDRPHPNIFETVVFGNNEIDHQYTRRCDTWNDAMLGHMKIVCQIRRAL